MPHIPTDPIMVISTFHAKLLSNALIHLSNLELDGLGVASNPGFPFWILSQNGKPRL